MKASLLLAALVMPMASVAQSWNDPLPPRAPSAFTPSDPMSQEISRRRYEADVERYRQEMEARRRAETERAAYERSVADMERSRLELENATLRLQLENTRRR